jgi:hypothetical protein
MHELLGHTYLIVECPQVGACVLEWGLTPAWVLAG